MWCDQLEAAGMQYSTAVIIQLVLLLGELKRVSHLRHAMVSSVMVAVAP